MEHLLHQGLVDHLMDFGADIHIDQPVVAHVGMDAIGKENINQVMFGIGPGQGAGKAGVAKAER